MTSILQSLTREVKKVHPDAPLLRLPLQALKMLAKVPKIRKYRESLVVSRLALAPAFLDIVLHLRTSEGLVESHYSFKNWNVVALAANNWQILSQRKQLRSERGFGCSLPSLAA